MSDTNNAEGIQDPEEITIEKIREKHRQQIALMEKKQTETIHSLIWSYEKQAKEKQLLYEGKLGSSDALLHDALTKLEQQLKSSWTWRIGWAQTSSVILLINFIKNPIKFFTDKRYRWKDLYYFPEPKPVQPQTQELKPVSNEPASKMVDVVAGIDPEKLTLVCVFDTFTKSCFAPEFNIISPTPDNWKKVFEQNHVDAVFIESAWHGNDNSWETLTTNFLGINKLETLQNMVATAKSNGIPTIFWNKEDPVYFNGFIDTAKIFDYVFTSDAEIIPKYQELVNHRNIFALPFAAQEKIHNPIRKNSRSKTVSFAGSYYNFSFAERKLDLDILLKPSLPFGLEIYDRNYGATGLANEEYKFPDIYQPAIKGKLGYADMIDAYKAYKVFLNVNSVKYSSTMFARRVFELLACGTPVISNYSKGVINLLGEETVFITESEDDTRKYLEQLLGDDHYWWKKSLQGMRKVIEHHTYQERAGEIFSITGHNFKKPAPVSFLILAQISSVGDAKYMHDLIRDQEYPPAGAVFVTQPGSELSGKDREEILQLNTPVRAVLVTTFSDQAIRSVFPEFAFTHVAFLSPKHFYGRNYLRDYALAVKYSDARILGKKEWVTLAKSGLAAIPALNADYRWVNGVHTDSLVIEKALLPDKDVCRLLISPEYLSSASDVFSLDPFNFLPNGKGAFLETPDRVSETIGI